MKSNRTTATTIAGSLYLLGFVAGILSIAYAIDDPNYLIQASKSVNATLVAAFFHLLMAPIYLGIAISLYPDLKQYNQWLAFGFAAFRSIASVLLFIGAIITLLLLILSQEFVSAGSPAISHYQTIGVILQSGRDLTNHVATILAVNFGGLLLYTLVLRAKLIPRWLSVWGLIGTILTIIASYLVMFQLLEIITPTYIIMNSPMALQEIVLGLWLVIKGFNTSET